MISASSMLGNFLQHLPGIMYLIDTVFMLVGLFLIGNGLRLFVTAASHHGGAQYLSGAKSSVWIIPIMSLIIGVLLFNRFTTATMMLNSFFGAGVNPNTLLSYSGSSINKEFDALIKLISLIMKMFGYITFFMGWLTLRNPEVDGAFKMGASKIIFGVFLINNIATINGLTSLFGFGDVF